MSIGYRSLVDERNFFFKSYRLLLLVANSYRIHMVNLGSQNLCTFTCEKCGTSYQNPVQPFSHVKSMRITNKQTNHTYIHRYTCCSAHSPRAFQWPITSSAKVHVHIVLNYLYLQISRIIFLTVNLNPPCQLAL